MDDIVERFLETKLEKELKDAQAAASGPGLKTKLNSILRDCEELKDKVKEKKGTGRDKLYNLLNVITEWHDLSAKTNCPAAKSSRRLATTRNDSRWRLGRGRYLVVLDDVWIDKEKDKFVMDEKIHKLFDFLNRPLGTLVVTSRTPEVLGADYIDVHKLLPLADRDSCLNIFNDACKEEIKLSKDEKNGIVEKCSGLPLMAKMLGEIGPPPVEET
ncbi:hypothetical protein SASPL_122561 [Salvia splendens]|uniref:NB-ARC domain-containing protein n=1 Tax=Salvia splendens TaxID=180675 RepID=A0A8X8XNK4_SALSN|nr:hypothetical protein SASPL_122561 [Salvia splendens]